jgi:hypothetical protein
LNLSPIIIVFFFFGKHSSFYRLRTPSPAFNPVHPGASDVHRCRAGSALSGSYHHHRNRERFPIRPGTPGNRGPRGAAGGPAAGDFVGCEKRDTRGWARLYSASTASAVDAGLTLAAASQLPVHLT